MAAEPPTQPPITGSDIQRLLGLTPAVKPDDEKDKKEGEVVEEVIEEVIEKPKVMTGEEMARLAGVKYGPREEEEGKEGTAAWGRQLAREQQEEEERKEGRLSLRQRVGDFPPADAAAKAPYLLDPSHPEYISEKEWIAQQEAQRTQPSLQPIRHILRSGHRDPTLPKITTPLTEEEAAKRKEEMYYAPSWLYSSGIPKPQGYESVFPLKGRSAGEAVWGSLESDVSVTKDIVDYPFKLASDAIVWGMKKAVGADEEMTKEAMAASGEMTGMVAGLKYGMDIQKVPFGHPIAKAFAPPIGMGLGYLLGKHHFKGEAPTTGELAQVMTYGSAYSSILSQLPKLGYLRSIGIGAVELNVIGEIAAQQQMLIDESKPSPIGTDEFWKRHAIETGLGGLVGLAAAHSGKPPKLPSSGTKEVVALKGLEGKHARLAKAQRLLQDKALNPKAHPDAKSSAVADLEILAPKISKVEGEILALSQSVPVRNHAAFRAIEVLDNRLSKYRKIAKNRTNTRGQRNTAEKLAKQLEDDIALFSANWERFGETVKNNPQWTGRLIAHLKQEEALKNAAMVTKHGGREEVLKKTLEYFKAFEKGDKDAMLAQARLLEGSVPRHAPTAVGRAYKIPTWWEETKGILDPRVRSERAGTGVGGETTFLSWAARAGVPRRLYLSQVNVLIDAARKSPLGRAGRVTESEAWKLALKMQKALEEGESLSAANLDTLWGQAKKLGYGRTGPMTGEQLFKLKQADEQVEQIMRTLYEGEPPPNYKLKLDDKGLIPVVEPVWEFPVGVKMEGELVPTFKRGLLEAKKAKEKGEPWAMSREEFAASGIEGGEKAHEAAVRKAFEANKPVPIKVEGQFPKLAKEFQEKRGWASQLQQQSVSSDPKIGNVNIIHKLRLEEARRLYDEASPTARAIFDGWRKTQESIGRMMENQGLIIEGKEVNHRFLWDGTVHYPRMVKQEIKDALNNLGKLNTKGRKAAYQNLLKWHKLSDTKESKKELAKIYKEIITKKTKDGDATSMTYKPLEMAREGTEFHPQVFDYTPEGMGNYVASASERIEQIRAYGQAKTLEGKTNPEYAFERAKRYLDDDDTKAFIDDAEKSVSVRNSPAWQAAHGATTLAKIANPYSAMKNLTGFLQLAKHFDAWGVSKAAAKALRDNTLQTFGGMDGKVAEQLGIVNKNMARVTELIGDSPSGKGFSKAVTGGLEVSTFGPSERLVRQGAYRVAEANVVDFVNLHTKIGGDLAKKIAQYEEAMFLHPTADAKIYLDNIYKAKVPFGNRDIRKYGESVRWMIRNHIDPNKIFREAMNPPTEIGAKVGGHKGGVLPETRAYYKKVSNVTQGGYRYSHLPQHMLTSPLARASQKFTSWSKQMNESFQENVVAEANRGNWKPLAKHFVAGQLGAEALRGAGSATGLSRGYGSREASYDEILSLLEDEDYPEAAKQLLIRGAYNIWTAGQGDMLFDTVAGMEVMSREGFGGSGAPIGPLMESSIKLIKDGTDYYRHGSEKVLVERLARQVSAFNRGSRAATAAGVMGEDKKELARMINLKSRMKGMAERFREHAEIDDPLVEPASEATEFTTGRGYDFKNELTDALLLGRGDRAQKLFDDYIKKKDTEVDGKLTPMQIDKIKKSLGNTVRNRRPIHVGNTIKKEDYEKFRSWIAQFNPKLANSIFEMDTAYWRAALETELIAPEKEMTRAQEFERKSRNMASVNRVKGEALFDLWWEGVDHPLMSPEQKKLHHRQAGKNIEGVEAREESLEKMMKDSWAKELSTRGAGQYVYKTPERTAEYIAANRRRVFTRSLLFAKTLDHRLAEVLLEDGFNMSQPEDRIAYLKERWDDMEISKPRQQELFKKLEEWKILGEEDLMMKASVEEAERKEREKKK